MGVVIENLKGGDDRLECNWWQWRPTVELIRSFSLLEGERLDFLSEGIGELAEEEAHQVADLLQKNVLPTLSKDERVLIDGARTIEPDDGTFHREPDAMHRNYGASKDWLANFAHFCQHSSGIRVY